MNTNYNKIISDILLESQKKLSEQLRLSLANSIDLSPIAEAQQEMFRELNNTFNKVIQDMVWNVNTLLDNFLKV